MSNSSAPFRHIIKSRLAQNTTFTMNISAELFLGWNEFDRWYIPTVVFMGILGNIFACWILSTTKLSRLPSSVYLATLAISDTGHLLSYAIFWLSNVGFDVYNTVGVCQVVTFLLNYFMVLSSWVVVLFTVERFFVVHHPLSSLARCSVSKARRNCLILAIFPIFITLAIPFTIGIHPERNLCGPLPNWSQMIMIQHIVDTSLGLFIPLLLTTALNIKLSVELFKSQRIQMLLTQSSQSESQTYQKPIGMRLGCCCSQMKWSKEARVTWNLMFISTVFSILTFPHALVSLNHYVTLSFKDLHYVEMHYCLSRLAHDVLCLNFALDFWLYNFSSSNFRTQATLVLRKWFRCRLDPSQLQSTQSGSTNTRSQPTGPGSLRIWTTSLRR